MFKLLTLLFVVASPRSAGGDLSAVVVGDITSASVVNKFGENDDIDSSPTFEDIWQGGNGYTGMDPTAAEIVTVTSSAAADAAAGTGARTVDIFGLDANYDPISETITLAGVALVDSTLSYIRLNRAIVRTAGTGGGNAGILSITQKVTTANVMATVAIGYNQTMVAAYTVPNGKVGYLYCWYSSFAKRTASGSVEMRFLARPEGEVWQVKEEVAIGAAGTSSFSRQYLLLKGPYAEHTDVKVAGSSDTVDIGVAAGFTILLVDM